MFPFAGRDGPDVDKTMSNSAKVTILKHYFFIR